MATISLKPKVKRKRTVPAEDSRSVTIVEDSKRSKLIPENTPFQFDLQEVEQSDANSDLEKFLEACSGISESIRTIRQLKQSDSKDEEIKKLRKESLIKFIVLKKLNRLSHVRCKSIRETTSQAKEKMDEYHLRLQNLLYEFSHLQKEITKCLEFRSKDEEIDLVPLEDFIKDAPAEISKLNEPNSSEHTLKLARLDWELELRKRLSVQLSDTVKERDVVAEDIAKRREHLDGLEPKLTTVLETTKPIQDYLDLPFDKKLEDHRKASYLPPSLYVLYTQITAYQEASDKNIEIKIEGDLDLAKDFKTLPVEQEEEFESESEEIEKEKKISKRRRKTVEDKVTSLRDVLFRCHPLHILIIIKCQDGNAVILDFQYLDLLKVTCVKVKLRMVSEDSKDSPFFSSLVSADTLLLDLYPADDGRDLLNQSTRQELSKFSPSDLCDITTAIGQPFLWVQWLCGSQVLATTPDQQMINSTVRGRHVGGAIRRIRSRLSSRLSLARQLQALSENKITVEKSTQVEFPSKIVSKLTSWSVSSFAHFQTLSYTQYHCDNGLVSPQHLYFSASAQRESAKMEFEVIVPPDYPNSPPIFVILIDWKAQTRTAFTDFNVQAMELELNVHFQELVSLPTRDLLLTHQVMRLLMCMDVYLETDDMLDETSNEISKDHIFPKIAKGPHRRKPYKYDAELGVFMHR